MKKILKNFMIASGVVVIFYGFSVFVWLFMEVYYFPMRSVFPGYIEVFDFRFHIVFIFPYFISLFILAGFLFMKFYCEKNKKVSKIFKFFLYLFLVAFGIFCSVKIYNSINKNCENDPMPSRSMCGTWIGWR